MKRRSILIAAPAAVLVNPVQAAPDSIANPPSLPLRNLLIEVRQVQTGDSQSDALGGGVQGQLQLQQRQSQQSGTATQQVLVLNGRSVRIALGAQVPVRVLQTWVRDGRAVITQGNVLLEAGTGFSATPRWDGSDRVELEIATQQALGAPGNLPGTATAPVSCSCPGGMEYGGAVREISSGQRSGVGGSGRTASQSQFDVQVRVTLR